MTRSIKSHSLNNRKKKMNFNALYMAQVDLLLDVLPVINKFDCFVLKGGTAINLFVRDMPRLSVDIDLAYLPIEPRKVFLENITSQLSEMQKEINNLNLLVKPSYTKGQQLAKLFVYKEDVVIKIEPNLVIRGSAFDCEEYGLCQKAQDQFLKFSRVTTLSIADLYGGKICAALDRQHPRDLFDVKILFENQGITNEIRQAFLVYLVSSPRPIHELLNGNPNLVGFEEKFNKEFSGMADEMDISSAELMDIRFQLIHVILNDFTENERKFLISFKRGFPDWNLITVHGIENLPAVKWKLENIKKIPDAKKEKLQDNLGKILGL